MKVSELIEKLKQYNKDLSVQIAYDSNIRMICESAELFDGVVVLTDKDTHNDMLRFPEDYSANEK